MMSAASISMVKLLALILFVGNVAGLYSSGSSVISLTSTNFESKIQSGGIWLVEFYAPWCGHCKNLAPEWEKAATVLKGIANVAALDADEHKDLAQKYKIEGFPTIKCFFTDASGRLVLTEYDGSREASAIVKWIAGQVQKVGLMRLGIKGGTKSSGKPGADSFYDGTDVTLLDDANFHKEVVDSDDLWFVEFYAPWCGHCKALKPAWMELATALDGKVRVGAVDCTVNQATCQEHGVPGYPTIKFFGSNKQKPEAYEGVRDLASLIVYANERWAKAQPPPEVRELTDNEVWVDYCIGHEADAELDLKAVKPKQLCLLSFLPHILDSKAAGRKAHLDMLTTVAASYKDRPFSWFWGEGGSQPELEANAGVGGYGYPAFIALNPSKGKYATLKGSFDAGSIKEFMDAVRTGRERVAPIEGPLATLATRAPWDGNDGEEAVEDEFSLEDLGIGGAADEAKDEL